MDDYGLTALHHAVSRGYPKTASVLIGRGADINAQRVGDAGNTWTPLHLAAEHDQVDCARLLLEAGADPDPKDEYGQTPLFLATDQENNHLVSPDVARLLIEYGANIKGTNVNQDWTGIDPDARVEARLEALKLLAQATRVLE